jgi:hypothetical protein
VVDEKDERMPGEAKLSKLPSQTLSRVGRLLLEQLDFLQASCERFDSGHEHEAKRIALTLRVLLHDTSASQSLLTQLGIKNKTKFLDTDARLQPRPPGVQRSFPTGWPLGLVYVEMGAGVRYGPMLGTDPELFTSWRDFDDWWNHELVRSEDGDVWGRKRFVTGMAHSEGGAHVDPAPSRWWRSLRDGEWVGAGAFQVGLGAVLLLATISAGADALAVGLLGVGAGSAAHTISHLVGLDLGGTPARDIPLFTVLTLVLVGGGLLRWRE